jgi:hypothetical protein
MAKRMLESPLTQRLLKQGMLLGAQLLTVASLAIVCALARPASASTCTDACAAPATACHQQCGTNSACHSQCEATYYSCVASCATPTATTAVATSTPAPTRTSTPSPTATATNSTPSPTPTIYCESMCGAAQTSCRSGCGQDGSCHNACDATFTSCVAACYATPTSTRTPTPTPTATPVNPTATGTATPTAACESACYSAMDQCANKKCGPNWECQRQCRADFDSCLQICHPRPTPSPSPTQGAPTVSPSPTLPSGECERHCYDDLPSCRLNAGTDQEKVARCENKAKSCVEVCGGCLNPPKFTISNMTPLAGETVVLSLLPGSPLPSGGATWVDPVWHIKLGGDVRDEPNSSYNGRPGDMGFEPGAACYEISVTATRRSDVPATDSLCWSGEKVTSAPVSLPVRASANADMPLCENAWYCPNPTYSRFATRWSYKPLRIANAQKGDVILLDNPSEVIRGLIQAAGMRYTHTVMVTSDPATPTEEQEITNYTTHNEATLLSNAIDGDPLGIPINPHIDPELLGNIPPGHEITSWDRYWKGGNANSPLLLRPRNRGQAQAAADVFRSGSMAGRYKLAEYSSFQFNHADGNGAQCASGIAHAWNRANGGGFVPSFRSRELRLEAATRTRGLIFEMVRKLKGDTAAKAAGAQLANQVTNCFAGLGCDDTSETWRFDIQPALSVAPDDLASPIAGGGGVTPYEATDEKLNVVGGTYGFAAVCENPNNPDPNDFIFATPR